MPEAQVFRVFSECFLFAFTKKRQNGPGCRSVVGLFAAAFVALFVILFVFLSGSGGAHARTQPVKFIGRDFYPVRIFPEEF